MAQDYAKKKKPGRKKKRHSKIPVWVWVFSTTISVGFVGFLAYLAIMPQPGDSSQAVTDPIKQEKPSIGETVVSTAKAIKNSLKPDLDFYDLLPEREVKVDVGPLTRERKAKRYRYILQAGSFRNLRDADRRRAELLLLGLETKIKTGESQTSGTTWHRVMVGPFQSRSKLAKARSTLINRGIDTLTIRSKIG